MEKGVEHFLNIKSVIFNKPNYNLKILILNFLVIRMRTKKYIKNYSQTFKFIYIIKLYESPGSYVNQGANRSDQKDENDNFPFRWNFGPACFH